MASTVWRNLQSHLQRFSKPGSIHGHKQHFIIRKVKECGTFGKRGMASERTILVEPPRYEWNRFKNDSHHYLMFGAVPLGAIVLYSNFVLGQAELADIPEDYEPKYWEYHKHPISRWFARYLYDDPVKLYEMRAAESIYQFEQARHLAQVTKVKELMKRNDDYRSYYFVPAIDPRYEKWVKEIDAHDTIYEEGTAN